MTMKSIESRVSSTSPLVNFFYDTPDPTPSDLLGGVTNISFDQYYGRSKFYAFKLRLPLEPYCHGVWRRRARCHTKALDTKTYSVVKSTEQNTISLSHPARFGKASSNANGCSRIRCSVCRRNGHSRGSDL